MLLGVAWPVAGCSKKAEPIRVSGVAEFTTPALDPSGVPCADVAGDLRVCWGAPDGPRCANGMCVVERPVPPVAISPPGFRCTGSGATRRCRDRALDAPNFRCEDDVCKQPHPRMPDDGEWECAATAGAVTCRGGQPPAAIPKGSTDAGFFCGVRRTGAGATSERICVDFSPDFPNGKAEKQRCSFQGESGVVRTCEPDENAHSLGDACDHEHACIDGARCIAGHCVPVRPEPSCWLPADCDHGTCRFGTCTEDPT